MAKALPTEYDLSNQLIATINHRLALDAFVSQPFTVEPLQRSSTHPVYLVSTASKTYLLKWIENTAASFNSPERQIVLQTRLASQGVSVEVCYAPADYQYILMPYLGDCSLAQLKQENMRNKTNLLAQQLVRLHQLNAEAEELNLAKILRQNLLASGISKNLMDRIALLIDDIETWWQQQKQVSTLVFCHLDLSFDNVLDIGSPKVIDWEYAAMSLPLYDLASCIAINQLSPRMQRWLLDDYLVLIGKSSEIVVQEKRLKIFVEIAELCNHLWYFAMKKVDNPKQHTIVLTHLVERLCVKLTHS